MSGGGREARGRAEQSVRILLVDDQELVRAGFRMVLDAQADMTVVGEAGDGAAALGLLRAVTADVVVMDVRMPRLDGIEATRRLIDRFAPLFPADDAPAPPGLDCLTGREREVLAHVAQGLSNAEIAGRLFVSEATVKTHVGRVLAKLGLRDRVQAVVFAYETGLVKARGPA